MHAGENLPGPADSAPPDCAAASRRDGPALSDLDAIHFAYDRDRKNGRLFIPPRAKNGSQQRRNSQPAIGSLQHTGAARVDRCKKIPDSRRLSASVNQKDVRSRRDCHLKAVGTKVRSG
jgi:hypothetical protein